MTEILAIRADGLANKTFQSFQMAERCLHISALEAKNAVNKGCAVMDKQTGVKWYLDELLPTDDEKGRK